MNNLHQLLSLSLLLLGLLLFTGVLMAQDQQRQGYGSLAGRVLDDKTGRPLVGVNVVLAGTRQGATTDENGRFIISRVAAGSHTILFDFVGFNRNRLADITVSANQAIEIRTIRMTERIIPLKEVVVAPGSYSMMGDQPSIRQTLSSEDIKIMGWAEDITRAVQRIPGITSNEFSAKFAVRGGDADEVLVLLDGMQIYKPFHQKDFGGGLFSTVDIEAIDGVDLLTGGFTADYGDRMSGVLNMSTRAPAQGQRETSLGFSLMNTRLFSMGTFNDAKGSYLLSIRRGYLDLLNKLMGNEFKLEPTYYDALAKIEHRLNDQHTLAVYGFVAEDAYKLDERVVEPGRTEPNIDYVDTNYGNNYGWLTLKSLLTPRLFGRTILYAGSVTQKRFWEQFDDDPNEHLNSADIKDDRNFDVMGVKQDWDYEASDNLLLKMGVEVKRLEARYDYFNSIDNEFITAEDSLIRRQQSFENDLTASGNQIGLHLSTRFRLGTPLALETGIRYDNIEHSNDQLWSPRVSLVYAPSRNSSFRAGWGYYYQSHAINELDIQFGETNFQPAERAEHFVAGVEHLFGNGLHFRAEAYYKRMTGLRDAYITFADIDEFFPEARDDLVRLSFDGGTARGIELYLKYDRGKKFSIWLSYVLSEATNQVTAIGYDGRLIKQLGTQQRPWDQPHTINLDMNYRMSRSWHFNMAWQYRTGWPGTAFTVQRKQRSDGTFAYYHDYGLFNAIRYPNYQRLDLRVNKHFFPGNSKVSVFLHVINIYNHENVITYDHEILSSNAENFQHSVGAETWFGILPFAGVSWEW